MGQVGNPLPLIPPSSLVSLCVYSVQLVGILSSLCVCALTGRRPLLSPSGTPASTAETVCTIPLSLSLSSAPTIIILVYLYNSSKCVYWSPLQLQIMLFEPYRRRLYSCGNKLGNIIIAPHCLCDTSLEVAIKNTSLRRKWNYSQ